MLRLHRTDSEEARNPMSLMSEGAPDGEVRGDVACSKCSLHLTWLSLKSCGVIHISVWQAMETEFTFTGGMA